MKTTKRKIYKYSKIKRNNKSKNTKSIKKRSMTKTKNNHIRKYKKKQSGGELLGSGAFGCAVTYGNNVVAKIFKHNDEKKRYYYFNQEVDAFDMLSSTIDSGPKRLLMLSLFFSKFLGACTMKYNDGNIEFDEFFDYMEITKTDLSSNEEFKKDLIQCLKREKHDNGNYPIIFMNKVGDKILNHMIVNEGVYKYSYYQNYIKIAYSYLNFMCETLIAAKLLHSDIKSDNILFSIPELNKTVKDLNLYFIDVGSLIKYNVIDNDIRSDKFNYTIQITGNYEGKVTLNRKEDLLSFEMIDLLLPYFNFGNDENTPPERYIICLIYLFWCIKNLIIINNKKEKTDRDNAEYEKYETYCNKLMQTNALYYKPPPGKNMPMFHKFTVETLFENENEYMVHHLEILCMFLFYFKYRDPLNTILCEAYPRGMVISQNKDKVFMKICEIINTNYNEMINFITILSNSINYEKKPKINLYNTEHKLKTIENALGGTKKNLEILNAELILMDAENALIKANKNLLDVRKREDEAKKEAEKAVHVALPMKNKINNKNPDVKRAMKLIEEEQIASENVKNAEKVLLNAKNNVKIAKMELEEITKRNNESKMSKKAYENVKVGQNMDLIFLQILERYCIGKPKEKSNNCAGIFASDLYGLSTTFMTSPSFANMIYETAESTAKTKSQISEMVDKQLDDIFGLHFDRPYFRFNEKLSSIIHA